MRGINLPTLPVRVLDFLPRSGEPGDRLTAILDRCPELLDLNLKIGVGMKILDTVPWISREYSQLSATLPLFPETGWYSTKVPLYIISLGNDNGIEVPIQSWCFGQFDYKSTSSSSTNFQSHQSNLGNISGTITDSITGSITGSMGSSSTMIENPLPFKSPFSVQDNLDSILSSYELSSSLPMNNGMSGIPSSTLQDNFSVSNEFPTMKPISLSQEILQKVDQTHPILSELEASLFPDHHHHHNHHQDLNGMNLNPLQTKPNLKPDTLKELFLLPDYQPRLRMSTYTTHLRSSLESANYFPPETSLNSYVGNDHFSTPSQDHPHRSHNDGNDPSSTFDPMNLIFGSEPFDPCTRYSDELKALMLQGERNFTKSHSPATSFSSLSTPPDVTITTRELLSNQMANITSLNLATDLELNSTLSTHQQRKRVPTDPTTNLTKRIRIPYPEGEPHDTGILSPPPSGKLYPKLQPKPISESTTPTTFSKKTPHDTKLSTSLSDIIKESSYHHLDKRPYHGVLNRADLILLTDISEMVNDWTDDERTVGRRLLRFQRRHEENTLYCQFEPISQATYLASRSVTPHSDDVTPPLRDARHQIVISVIHWPGLPPTATTPDHSTTSSNPLSDYYITSVDVVNLLEGLLGVTFTLEEKNRIRRNLELFGPITVMKGSPTTGDLFRQIMAFPAPRPRNIEKGIKVFPYHQLPQALRKVVGKHTASRSSTLRVNLLPLELNSFPEPIPTSSSVTRPPSQP